MRRRARSIRPGTVFSTTGWSCRSWGWSEANGDLRPTIDAYLGHTDFRGARVLDVGAASGFLTFEMERRGADVVSFDSQEDAPWDIVPIVDVEAAIRIKRDSRDKLLNAYWLAHRLLGSKASAVYGNIYDLPDELGSFDVAVLGSVLLHLRDPFGAMQSVARLCHGTLIITDHNHEAAIPAMEFLPSLRQDAQADTWWLISTSCMKQMLAVLGFEDVVIEVASHACVDGETTRPFSMSTFTARRTAPRNSLGAGAVRTREPAIPP